MNPREHRRVAIKRLIHEHRIASQEELVQLLAEEGVTCTQATLSRDLRDMGIIRRTTAQGAFYVADKTTAYIKALKRVVGMEILNVRHNGHLVVVRTLAGRAEGVAAYLDNLGHDNILGTLAGDDTVFVAPVDAASIHSLVEDIRRLEILAEEEPP